MFRFTGGYIDLYAEYFRVFQVLVAKSPVAPFTCFDYIITEKGVEQDGMSRALKSMAKAQQWDNFYCNTTWELFCLVD